MKMVSIICLLLAVLMIGSGCASYYVLDGSRDIRARRLAVESNNEDAIRALDMGGEAVAFGIDVSNMEALKERPWLQAGAAILDAAILYAGVRGVQMLNDDDDSGNRDEGSSRDVYVDVSGSTDVDVDVNVSETHGDGNR